jgi:amino-acid N-acetyltransferase
MNETSTKRKTDRQQDFVHWFRAASPYIRAHRGQTFVICFGGEAILDPEFSHLIHDIALLSSLGIRLILVHGAEPQWAARLKDRGLEPQWADGQRVVTEPILNCAMEAACLVGLEVESWLSAGLPNSPMAGARIRCASGNVVAARPRGVRNGVDFGYSGEVRRVDAEPILARLNKNEVVLLSPIGYSPTGELFTVDPLDVAASVAVAVNAGKLIFLMERGDARDTRGRLLRQITQTEAKDLLETAQTKGRKAKLPVELEYALRASRGGVRRTHLIDRRIPGALVLELFSRDGIGTMVSAEPFDTLRKANIYDVGGILELIEPLENDGVLVRRSREKLETEIEHFKILLRDGAIIGCAALYPIPGDSSVELACLAVHPDYRDQGRGNQLFESLAKEAKAAGLKQVYVLTTQTEHWFLERGFRPIPVEDLPAPRKSLYNYQRKSKVFVKEL